MPVFVNDRAAQQDMESDTGAKRLRHDAQRPSVVTVRPARREDGPALAQLEHDSPRGSGIVITERRHDFFQNTAIFTDSIALILERDKNSPPAAVIAGSLAPVRLAGDEVPALLMSEFYADAQVPRGLDRGMLRLMIEFVAAAREQGAHVIFGVVKSDNDRAMSIYERAGARRCGTWRLYTLTVVHARKVAPGVVVTATIDAAVDQDEVRAAFGGLDLFPADTPPGGWQWVYDRFVRARVSCGGASCKIWDATADCERIVVDLPLGFRLLRPLANALARVVPVPRSPAAGATVATWIVYDLVVTPQTSPAPLLAAVNNLALEHGVDYVVVVTNRESPVTRQAGRGAIAVLDYVLVVKDLDGASAPRRPAVLRYSPFLRSSLPGGTVVVRRAKARDAQRPAARAGRLGFTSGGKAISRASRVRGRRRRAPGSGRRLP